MSFGHGSSVLLLDPRYPHNVGNALRACALLGAQRLYWTGDRVPPPDEWPAGSRLPREERMKCYRRTELRHVGDVRAFFACRDATPVCVEISDASESLDAFVHPERAIYVFGPEDGDVQKGIRQQCHRFVQIPNAIDPADPDSRTPFNLATAVALTLFDRMLKGTLVPA